MKYKYFILFVFQIILFFQIIYALKGIKNIHHLEDSIVSKLVVCASDKNVKPRIRVAALETFGADPCIKQVIS